MKIFFLFAGAPRVVSLGLAVAAVALAACSQTPVTVTLHSLQASGNLSFVCQADDGSGLKLDECPDYELQHRRILGLVTQTATDEVAIVDLRGGAVVDVDPTTPGYTFLRVGATPGAIVSSPGGVASFVGVTGLQKNGVFALPTTCPRTAYKPPPDTLNTPAGKCRISRRGICWTTWAACSLSSAPGDMTQLVDLTGTDSGAAENCLSGRRPKLRRRKSGASAQLTSRRRQGRLGGASCSLLCRKSTGWYCSTRRACSIVLQVNFSLVWSRRRIRSTPRCPVVRSNRRCPLI